MSEIIVQLWLPFHHKLAPMVTTMITLLMHSTVKCVRLDTVASQLMLTQSHAPLAIILTEETMRAQGAHSVTTVQFKQPLNSRCWQINVQRVLSALRQLMDWLEVSLCTQTRKHRLMEATLADNTSTARREPQLSLKLQLMVMRQF